jgi:hypothetical protein
VVLRVSAILVLPRNFKIAFTLWFTYIFEHICTTVREWNVLILIFRSTFCKYTFMNCIQTKNKIVIQVLQITVCGRIQAPGKKRHNLAPNFL